MSLYETVIRLDGSISNPFDNILPNFSIFGAEFTQLWQKVLAGVWGIGIIVAAVVLIVSLTSMSAATTGQNPAEYKTGRTRAMWAAISLAGLAAVGVITGAILAVVS